MSRRVRRPKASKNRIQSKNEFELCYLRHQYFRRVKYNPTQADMKPFSHIATHLAKNTFFVYRNLFHTIGFESEDLVNIAHVHLVSFLGLFSLDKMPEKYKDFCATYKRIHHEKPEEDDILDKNQANFTLFLKQRMEDVVRVCRQKARNIKGLPTEENYYYYSAKPPPKNHRELIKNYEKLGFKKLDTAVYKSIKKRAGTIYGSTFKFSGLYYVAVPLDKKTLSLDDFSGAGIDPHDNLHNMTPEEVYFNLEDTEVWENRRADFDAKSAKAKTNLILRFIKKHGKKEEFKEEVRTAKRLLRELE